MSRPADGARAGQPAFRTFKPRRRRLTPARAELFERLAPAWCLGEQGGTIDAVDVFGRCAPLVVEIGIGLGETLTEMAAADRSTDVIGIDVHTPGIASTLARIETLGLANVRLVHGDAVVFLQRLPPASLAGMRIYFPDPWPKQRHRHRRIVGRAHVDQFVALLAPGGTFHVATDIADYAAQVRELCDAHPALAGGVVERPAWRPVTRYEHKAEAVGRTATDLVYRRAG